MRKFTTIVLWIALLGIASAAFAQDGGRSAPPDPNMVRLVEAAGGFNQPLLVTHAGDGSNRLFVVEKRGYIWIVQDGARLPDPFLDIASRLTSNGYEQGLLGLAFHPNYAENGWFYVYYTDNSGGDTVVARYSVTPDNPNLADRLNETVILTQDQPYRNHNGGHLAFGDDGYLYIGLGDGGSAGDPLGAGQRLDTWLGKILRLDVDGGTPYAIPPDNPFVGVPNALPEIWAYGLRNPWRFSFDRLTGDLYIGDVGQNAYEEINFEPADSAGGLNYGWNPYEGMHPYSGAPAPDDMVLPIAEYSHQLGISITGGYVYRGALLPDLQGVYFYADFGSGNLWYAYRDAGGGWHSDLLMQTGQAISSFGEDEAGELYLTSFNGGVWRFEPAG
jgi:glucose/arabinose dehydrogenase